MLEAARDDGRNELPATHALSESATERSIRTICQQQLNKYFNMLSSLRNEYDTKRNAILNKWQVNAVAGQEPALVDDVVANGKKDIGPIRASETRLKNLADELYAFRRKHDLRHRLPVYRDLWHALLLLLIWFAVELVVTTFLLRESGGLIMVFIISVVYCFLNCFFPFVVAPFSRSINYKSVYSVRKILGWILLLAVFGLGIWLNLLMGHYRSAALELAATERSGSDVEMLEALVERVNNTGVTAWTNLIEAPWGITDTFSWMLAVAGFVAFALSFREGFVRNDVYPGYGELSRRFDEQRQAYDEQVKSLIETLIARRDRAVNLIERKKNEIVNDLGSIPHSNKRIETLEVNFGNACDTLENDFAGLIDEYRQENRKFRDSPEPQYFIQPVRLKAVNPDKMIPPDAPADIQALVVEKLSHFSTRLHDEFQELTSRVKPSSEILHVDPLQISTGAN